MSPVRDVHGHVVWQVRVAPNERTCLECGETFAEGKHCVNCCLNEDGTKRRDPPASVPTISYLNPDEWRLA